jgi:hypothetical protein
MRELLISEDDRDEPASVGRRRVLAGAAGLVPALALGTGVLAEDAANADFLFVQTARELAFDADRSQLTLNGISPVTLFFSDRPERIAGNMETARFVPFWSEGTDSFLSDPPNADISIIEDGTLRQVVVELRDPMLEGDALVYTAKVISGEMPVVGKDPSVFIDIIGMPRTPVSFAGADRRAFRRAALY